MKESNIIDYRIKRIWSIDFIINFLFLFNNCNIYNMFINVYICNHIIVMYIIQYI